MNIRIFPLVLIITLVFVPEAVFADHTNGHTIEHLRAQIAALQARLNALLGATAPPTVTLPPASTTALGVKFSIGDRIRTTDNLNVRATPTTSGQRLGTQLTGAGGAIIGGPMSANGFFWWSINYDAAPDGWSADKFLRKDAVAASPQTSVSPPAPEAPNADAEEAVLDQEIEAEVKALDADLTDLEARLPQ